MQFYQPLDHQLWRFPQARGKRSLQVQKRLQWELSELEEYQSDEGWQAGHTLEDLHAQFWREESNWFVQQLQLLQLW